MRKNFENAMPEEQETSIIIDYYESTLKIYTSRKITYTRLYNKLGEPTREYYQNKKLTGATWCIPFSEKKKLTSVLSRPLLIGNIK